jgi:uncharacterized UPF0160 family protein
MSSGNDGQNDADAVLLLALRQAALPLPDAEDLTLDGLVEDAGAFSNAVRTALGKIDPVGFKALPKELPSEDNVGERFRVAGAYAEALRSMGYEAEDLGFAQFLYPSAQSARSVLKFILDKLPRKEVEDAMSGGTSGDGLIKSERTSKGSLSRAVRAVGKSMRSGDTWGRAKALSGFAGIAAAAKAKKQIDTEAEAKAFRTARLSPSDERGFYGACVTDASAQLLPSVLEYTARSRAETTRVEDAQRLKFGSVEPVEFIGPDGKPFDLRKRGGLKGLISEIFIRAVEGGFYSEPKARRAVKHLQGEMDESKVVSAVKDVETDVLDTLEGRLILRERDMEDIQRHIDEAASVIAAVDDEIQSCSAKVEDAISSTEEKRKLTAELERTYLLHKQATGIVLSTDRPVEESEAELRSVLEAAKERMAQLTAEWEEAKTPLIAAIEAHAAAANEKRELAKKHLKDIEKWRVDGKETSSLLRVKEQEQRQLLEEYDQAPKNVHRPSFVRRVNEIVKNIKKQEGEIVKIVNDTRSVQQEIQSAESVLSRTYTVVEETLFREARADDLGRAAYKHLHGMHTGFADLVSKVEAAGRARRAQTDLQRKLGEMLKQPDNTDRVARDLSVVKETITSLKSKLGVQG